MLSDRSVLIGQKLMENAKIEKLKCDILGDFQTLCTVHNSDLVLTSRIFRTIFHPIEMDAFISVVTCAKWC